MHQVRATRYFRQTVLCLFGALVGSFGGIKVAGASSDRQLSLTSAFRVVQRRSSRVGRHCSGTAALRLSTLAGVSKMTHTLYLFGCV